MDIMEWLSSTWRGLFLILVAASCAWIFTSNHNSKYTLQPSKATLPKSNNIPVVKRILFLTPMFGLKDWGFGIGSDPFQRCSVKNCFATSEGNPEDFDAVLFHARNFEKAPDQKKRRHDQLYVFVSKESSINERIEKWTRLGGFFNWTMTYREDSEVLFPYGWISNKGKSPPKEQKETWLKPHPTSSRLVAKVKALGQRKPVAWLVSNCHTSSQRELYVNELQKYVPVDIFGRCGKPLKCTVGRDECFKEIEEQYQFYLSFENSLCRDYATEKLYRALASNLVPVVMGGANYSRIVPPRSVINSQDFASPELLGKELKRLAENESEYLEYYWWKEHYTVHSVVDAKARAFCDLCEKLHEDYGSGNSDSERGGEKYLDFLSWFQKDQCWKPVWEP